jgi:tetratricopeptide (TPR) repeat protein
MVKRLAAFVAFAGLLAAQRAPVETAWDLLAKGDRNGAVRVLGRIVETNPNDGDARLLLGSILAEDGNRDALPHLREAVRLMPQSAEAHNALGEAFRGFGDAKAARPEFEKAAALDPQFAQAHVNLGLVLVEAGEKDAAAGHLDRAIAILGRVEDSALPRYLRAKIYNDQDELEKAAAGFQEAVALRPDFAEAWSELGQARKAQLDYDGALAAFERSVALDPENAVSQYRLGAEYLRRGKPHDAVAHLREAFRLNPRDQSTLNSLQLALRQDGQPEEARRIREELSKVLRGIDEESRSAFTALRLNNEGAALEKSGDLRGALEKYREAVALDATHVGIRLNYGVALLRLGQWKEGLSELREALRRDPGNVQVKAALEDALEQAPVEFGGKGRAVPARKPSPAK